MDLFSRLRTESTEPGGYSWQNKKAVNPHHLGGRRGENKMSVKELERITIEHEIRAKLALEQPLSNRQRSYYLLFIATPEQAKEYLRKEKAVNL